MEQAFIVFLIIGVTIALIYAIYEHFNQKKKIKESDERERLACRIAEENREKKIRRYVHGIEENYMVNIDSVSLQKIILSDDLLKEIARHLPRDVKLQTYKANLEKRSLDILDEFKISQPLKSYAKTVVSFRISLIDKVQKENMIKIQDSMIPDNLDFLKGTINYGSIALNPLMDVAEALESKELEAAIYHYMATEGYTSKEIANKNIEKLFSAENDFLEKFQGIRTVDVLLMQYKKVKLSSFLFYNDNDIRFEPYVPKEVEMLFCCEKCGKSFVKKVKNMEECAVKHYKDIAKEYSKLGHIASVSLYCDDCEDAPDHNLVFSVTLNKSSYTHKSYPRLDYYGVYVGCEYYYTLSFLKGTSTYEKLGWRGFEGLNSVLGIEKIEEIYDSADFSLDELKEAIMEDMSSDRVDKSEDKEEEKIEHEEGSDSEKLNELVSDFIVASLIGLKQLQKDVDSKNINWNIYSLFDFAIFMLFNVYVYVCKTGKHHLCKSFWKVADKKLFAAFQNYNLSVEEMDKILDARLGSYDKIMLGDSENKDSDLLFECCTNLYKDSANEPLTSSSPAVNILELMSLQSSLAKIYSDTMDAADDTIEELLALSDDFDVVNQDTNNENIEETINMSFCRICGAKIPNDSVFCPNCGNQIKNS